MALNSEIRNLSKRRWRFCQCYTLSWKSKRRKKTNDNEMIFECFKDAQVLDYFKKTKGWRTKWNNRKHLQQKTKSWKIIVYCKIKNQNNISNRHFDLDCIELPFRIKFC
jgi:hypothetical protein